MHNTKFNLKQLIRQLELKHDRDYDYQDIAKAAGLSRFTVSSIANNNSVKIELRTINRLLDFFVSQGLDVTIADLFVVTTD